MLVLDLYLRVQHTSALALSFKSLPDVMTVLTNFAEIAIIALLTTLAVQFNFDMLKCW